MILGIVFFFETWNKKTTLTQIFSRKLNLTYVLYTLVFNFKLNGFDSVLPICELNDERIFKAF